MDWRGLRLALMAATQTVHIPETIATCEADGHAFLLMEFVETGYRKDGFWETFGQLLANMHQHSADQFGLDHPNYIGSLHQPNGHHDSFVEFYIYERLQPQFEMAFDAKKLNNSDQTYLANLYKRLPDIIPDEPPALIHGDLWSGNFLVGENNQL